MPKTKTRINPYKDVNNVLLKGFRPVAQGITKYREGDRLIVRVDVWNAKDTKGKAFLQLNPEERTAFDDFLYLSHIQEGHAKIIYV